MALSLYIYITDLYTKPTDKHLYLHINSSHPESTKKSIPYGLALRASDYVLMNRLTNNLEKILKLSYRNEAMKIDILKQN
jgi:hypothetical protein